MSIRVLHIGTEYTWRGGENQAQLLIEGLKNRVDDQFGATPKKSVAYKEKRWNCELLGLNSGNPYDPVNIFQVVKFVRSKKITIIDAHTAKAHTLALNVSIFLPDIKIVVHRRVDNKPKKNILTRYKYFHHRITRFTAISSYIREVLLEYGVSPDKICVARSAVGHEIYQKIHRTQCQIEWKKKYKIPANHILIGNASALSLQKGHQTLLLAIAELQMSIQNFSVLIAGDGDLKESLKKQSIKMGLSNRIQFIGFIKNVPEFLSSLDILAVPSNNEGLGTVILDGILAGCVVVGSRVGGIPEIITHNQTGLLQEVGDYKGLAQNLGNLIENPQLAEKLRLAAQKRVRDEFSLQSMVEGNYQIYQSIIK